MKNKFDFAKAALYVLWVLALALFAASVVLCCGDVLAPDIDCSCCIDVVVSCSLSDTATTSGTTTTGTTTTEQAAETSSVSTATTTIAAETSSVSTTTTTIVPITHTSSSVTAASTTSLITRVTSTTTASKTFQTTSFSTENCETSSFVEEITSASDTDDVPLTYLGVFRGTYYRGSTNPCRGGSGRTLINCVYGDGDVKGSIACRYIYATYGYSVDGRTKVYVEVPSYPSMTGWYYVDDCCQSYSVVDFYYPDYSACPFRVAGVISVNLYI